jgi:hypothetical protein
MNSLIITEYGIPSAQLYSYSNQLKSLPAPKYALGDIVIIPDSDGCPVYAVISLICVNRDTFPCESWVYGVTPESNPLATAYVPEHLVLSRSR